MAFITVRYGLNEERILNPNCISSVLLSHIKKSCGFESLIEPIDLCSADTGEVVDLISKPKEYAKKYLEPRGVYILLKVVGDDSEESTPTFVSLLESSNLKISTNPSKAKSKKTGRVPNVKTEDLKLDSEKKGASPLKKSFTDISTSKSPDRKTASPKKKIK